LALEAKKRFGLSVLYYIVTSKVFSPALWKFVFSVSMPEKFLL